MIAVLGDCPLGFMRFGEYCYAVLPTKVSWAEALVNLNYMTYYWHNSYYTQGPSWPWSYGSWIFNYLYNQCLSPLMLWVRISIRVRCTTFCDKFVNDLRKVGGFLRVLRFPPQ